MMLCAVFVWTGFGRWYATELASGKLLETFPPCPIESVLSCSKMLAKSEPTSNSGSTKNDCRWRKE